LDVFDVPVFPGDDDIAFCAQNLAYAYLTATVTKWVNEGFNDAAVYVEDLASTISQVYEKSYNQAIREVNICTNFKASVKLAVDLEFLKTQAVPPRSGCTITIAEDVEFRGLLTGESFSYDIFEKTYSDPSNNGMGGYLLTNSLATKMAENNKENVMTELDWSRGYWPFKDSQGKVVTPGQVISEQITKVLSMNTDHQMDSATELDRVLFMIYNQLIKKEVFTQPFNNSQEQNMSAGQFESELN
jgi:hypothetical protein